MDNGHDIKILNTLIETTLDSVRGYQDAAEDSQSQHAQLFGQMAQERSGVATRLQSLVTGLGGNAQDHTSLGAAAHRGFMNLKEAIMGSSEKAIVDEVERGEDYLKAKYEAALQDGELSSSTREAIQQAYQSVRAGHDRVSAIKHQMAG